MQQNIVKDYGPQSQDAILTYAIGDVHGHLEKLRALVGRCRRHRGAGRCRFVFIGDYFDRGPDSRGVIEFLMNLQGQTPDVICLRGNHEADLLDCARGADQSQWLLYGGIQTLQSYDVANAADIPRAHLDWAGSLPLTYDDGRRLFVHAGVNPEYPLSEQTDRDLLWIREPFLSYEGEYGRLIVHGHTPTWSRNPDVRCNRVNVDTGAGYDGPLTAGVFSPDRTFPLEFLVGDAVTIPA